MDSELQPSTEADCEEVRKCWMYTQSQLFTRPNFGCIFWREFVRNALLGHLWTIPILPEILEYYDARGWLQTAIFVVKHAPSGAALLGCILPLFRRMLRTMNAIDEGFFVHLTPLLLAAYRRGIPLMELLTEEERLKLVLDSQSILTFSEVHACGRALHYWNLPLCACQVAHLVIFLCCDAHLNVRPPFYPLWSQLIQSYSIGDIYHQHLLARWRARAILLDQCPATDCIQLILDYVYSPTWNLETLGIEVRSESITR